jgi:hypothetical protein
MDRDETRDYEHQEDGTSQEGTKSLIGDLASIPQLSGIIRLLGSDQAAGIINVLTITLTAVIPDQGIVYHPG